MVHAEEIMMLFLDPFASITHIVTVGDSSLLLTREQQTKRFWERFQQIRETIPYGMKQLPTQSMKIGRPTKKAEETATMVEKDVIHKEIVNVSKIRFMKNRTEH